MQRFAIPIAIAITALLLGIGIGRYTSLPTKMPSTTGQTLVATPASIQSPQSPVLPSTQKAAPWKTSSSAPSDSAEDILAKIKAGLTQFNSRHAYATFSKLAETIDEKNVRDVLAFVQTLPKPQEKSILVSLFVARWAELDPAAAIAYAQALP